jgi:hypothetical protein
VHYKPVRYRENGKVSLMKALIFTHLGSRIPDSKTATKERVEKKFVVIHFYVATSFTKLKIILFLKC